MHLDKLLSWDEIRESGEKVSENGDYQAPRLPESEYWMPEEHDVYAKVKILELSETGEYLPVEIEQQQSRSRNIPTSSRSTKKDNDQLVLLIQRVTTVEGDQIFVCW